MTTTSTYSVCWPCVAATANGIDSVEADSDPDWLASWRIRYALAVKHTNGEPILANRYGLWDSENEPFYFSWYPCHFCGDTLAGDRADCVIQQQPTHNQ